MTTGPTAIVAAVTRGWVRVYTARAPLPVAIARRAEIESDLWEMQHDPELGSSVRCGVLSAARLIGGIPHDIAWRLDNAAQHEQIILRRVCAFTAATVLVLSLWMVTSLFINGQQEVAACAAAAPEPQTTADLRFDVMRCAGAFFSSAR